MVHQQETRIWTHLQKKEWKNDSRTQETWHSAFHIYKLNFYEIHSPLIVLCKLKSRITGKSETMTYAHFAYVCTLYNSSVYVQTFMLNAYISVSFSLSFSLFRSRCLYCSFENGVETILNPQRTTPICGKSNSRKRKRRRRKQKNRYGKFNVHAWIHPACVWSRNVCLHIGNITHNSNIESTRNSTSMVNLSEWARACARTHK